MELNVAKNAKRNLVFGFINKLIVMLCPFATRTAIQYLLNAQYLGLNSLFNSILAVLSLAELGFSSAVVYNMYKPAAEGDVETINAFLLFFKKTYRIIGVVIAVMGVAIIPLLPHFIAGDYPSDINIVLLYLIFLFNTVISYFLYAYLDSIIIVHQRDDIKSICNMVIMLGLSVIQIIVLSVSRNFYLFILLMPMFTIINNLWIAFRVHKLFPQYKCEGSIDEKTKEKLKKLVVGAFLQRACATSRNSIDSLCISAFIGLTATAIYTNYCYIMNAVTQIMLIVSASLIGGIGNHVAKKSVEENFDELRKIDFAYLWISGWCATCLLCLYQPFMRLWMGTDMMLSMSEVVWFCIYFYLLKLGDMRSMYSATNGLWWHGRWRAVSETALNVILNIVLGKSFGIIGIIVATVISLIICNYLWSTRIVFKHYFGMEKLKKYYSYQMEQTVIMVVVCITTYMLCHVISTSSLIAELILKMLVCAIIPNASLILIYRDNTLFKSYFSHIILRKGNEL